MSRVRLFYIFITLALLVTGGVTFISAISTLDVAARVGMLVNGTPEKVSVVTPGQSPQASHSSEIFAPQTLLIGIPIVAIATFTIGWMLSRRNARRKYQREEKLS